MSSLTITLTKYQPGGSPPADIVYAANSSAPGKYARSLDPGSYIPDLKRFRTPGTDGYLIVRSGTLGAKITITVRYIGATLAAAVAAARADMKIMAQNSFNIVSMGQTWKGCNLIPGSVQQVTPYKSTGRGGVFFDLVMVFSEDQPDF